MIWPGWRTAGIIGATAAVVAGIGLLSESSGPVQGSMTQGLIMREGATCLFQVKSHFGDRMASGVEWTVLFNGDSCYVFKSEADGDITGREALSAGIKEVTRQ